MVSKPPPEVRKLANGLLAFQFGQVREEFRAFADIAGERLRPESIGQLRWLADELDSMSLYDHRQVIGFGTRQNEPLISLPSKSFEPNDGKAFEAIYGTVCFDWKIRPLGQRTRFPGARWFALLNSSVHIKLRLVRDDLILGDWDFDAGDDVSPGCHFHAKPRWKDLHSKASLTAVLSVPRLPTCLFMPTDCLEFLFGELWQDEWKKQVEKSDDLMNRWINFSLTRHRKLMKSQLAKFDDAAQLSGWMTMKTWKPNAQNFAES